MFRRKMQLSEVTCLALEGLRQALEVEFGSRVEFMQLDIDPFFTNVGAPIPKSKVSISGLCHYSLDEKMSAHVIRANVTLTKFSPELWLPREATIQFDHAWYSARWELRGARLIVLVAPSDTHREYFRVGSGYGPAERWDEPVDQRRDQPILS
ncbi:hypothetical protein KW782_02365 [Candidatus Parcubacteria bacterium]|nr:hypothetical protein [Candidatus Parcubacteria bacterium]